MFAYVRSLHLNAFTSRHADNENGLVKVISLIIDETTCDMGSG